MKKIYSIILFSALIVWSCNPDDPEFKSVDKSQITDFWNEISGPDDFTSKGTVDYEVSPRSNSTYEWAISGAAGATVTPDGTYPFMVSISVPENPELQNATVSVKETTDWGATKTFTMDVTIQPFCTYDPSSWAGDYSCNEPGYGDYPVTFTQDTDDPNKFWIDNFWDYGGTPYYIFDPNSFDITLPEQTISMGGSDYLVEGTGKYDQCAGTFYIDYLVDGGDTDDNRHTYTK